MALNDEQIERYSRQLILREIGPRGQERLLAARAAVIGSGIAAERVVAYLAAAGVGWIACEPALHACVDGAQPDLTMASPPDAAGEALDAAIFVAATVDDVAALLSARPAHATTICWIAAGLAGAPPPCPRCAAAALGESHARDVAPELTELRDALVGTVVATEVVKAILAIGTPLAGRVLGYDPLTATVTSIAAPAACAH